MHSTLLVVSSDPDKAEHISEAAAVEAINDYKGVADYAQEEVTPESRAFALDLLSDTYGRYVDVDRDVIHVRPNLATLRAHLAAASMAARRLIEHIDPILDEIDDDKTEPRHGEAILFRAMALADMVDSSLVDTYGIYVLDIDEGTIALPADEWLIQAQSGDECDYTVTQVFDFHI
jgi:hypothetical protein